MTIRVVVPHAAPSRSQRRALYVSPSTAKIHVSVNGGAASSAACSASGCTTTVGAPVGVADTFGVTLSDTSGNALSQATATQTIVPNTSNVVTLSYGGIVSSLALNVGSFTGPVTTSFVGGYSGSVTLTVIPQDADGNVILGTGAFTPPISLVASPPLPSSVTLSSAMITAIGPTDPTVTVATTDRHP